MNRFLIMFLLSILFIGCAGMTRDIKKEISNELQPSTLRQSYGTETPNLKELSKCAAKPIIMIINSEKNEEEFNITPRIQGTFKVNKKWIGESLTAYLRDAFRQCRITEDESSNKIIRISIKSLDGWYRFNSGATLRVDVFIPEKNMTIPFSTTQSAIDIHRAVVYAIHVLSWDIVNDPTVQDYILCK